MPRTSTFVFTEASRRTRPGDAVAEACHGCDILVHEVISATHLAGRTPDWQAYHHAYHTTGTELGEVAAKARPKLLVLYHQLPPNFDEGELFGEVHQHFKGRVVSGRDLDVF